MIEYRKRVVIVRDVRSAQIAYDPMPTPIIIAAVSIDAIHETYRGYRAAENPTSSGKKPEHPKPARLKLANAVASVSRCETAVKLTAMSNGNATSSRIGFIHKSSNDTISRPSARAAQKQLKANAATPADSCFSP